MVAGGFSACIAAIDDDLAERMSASWRPGCPVELVDLRHLRLTHWGFDGSPHQGELVVHGEHAAGIASVFATLFTAGFPVARMQLIDAYGGDDLSSIAANNTSAFNCRRILDRPNVWSQHALGLAIDVNPVQNPYLLADGRVLPPQGRAFLRRDPAVPGLITEGDVVVTAFASIGWGWGGSWPDPKDYQHFSATGG